MARSTIPPVHLHLQTNPRAPGVFHLTPERYEAAVRRHASIAPHVRVSFATDRTGLEECLKSADVLVGFKFPTDGLSTRAPRLKWIHVIGAGIEHLLPLDWLPPDVALVNNRGVHAEKAGEFALLAILMLNNAIPSIVTNQRRSQWVEIFTSAVTGKTLLVVGVGHMGGAAARRARQAGMRVLGIRRSGRPHRYVHEMYGPADLHRALPRADFLLLTTPLVETTRGLIGRRELDLLKPGAGVINMARARVMDYEALADKLERGEIGGAVLDVFDPEPLPPDSRFWSTPNLLVCPHVGSDDEQQYIPRTLDLVFDNIRRYLAGRPLRNRVRPELEY